MKKNIFIVGADEFNFAQLKTVPGAGDYRFHNLSSYEEAKGGEDFPVKEILEQSRRTLKRFSGSVDAIIGWWDFPVSTLLPILRREFDLPTPTLESVLKCEHKYWSRIEQVRCIPEHVPRFEFIDPFAQQAVDSVQIPFPFWLKPVKSASSYLGFKIHNENELREVLATIRKKIHRLANPFNLILEQAQLPDDIAGIDGRYCIAESIISQGKQCTLEGYVLKGEVVIYGVIDSQREGKHLSSFSRYEYPTTLPPSVCERMITITKIFLGHIEFDYSPFNIEFYWDTETDRIWLLEVNTRISKSHAPLFKMVDGSYHHQVMLEVALGIDPDFPHREGQYACAAKFMWRQYRDAIVQRIPSQAQIAEVRRRYPGAEVLLHVAEGQRLSELRDQDSYSYEIAVIFLGADNREDLLARYTDARETLSFEFAE